PAGFEMLTGEFSNGRGGEYTASINVVAGHTYYFKIVQKPGTITPDVVMIPVVGTQMGTIPPRMAAISFAYPNVDAISEITREQAKNNLLQKRLGCSNTEMREGTCQ
ncbi:MAG: hypothetical protein WBR29_10755, partial [Gammaproteobacteria bacterium]